MQKKPKLLIVEDDLLNQNVYKAIFSNDFCVAQCKNDKEFDVALRNDSYEIFLIDISLGGKKDGIQLIKELRDKKEYKLTPIIVVTAHAFKKDEDTAMAAGTTKFFRKPVNYQILVDEFKKYFPSRI